MPEINASTEWRTWEREVKAIRKDIAAARKIIADGLARYKKKMLKARSLKQVEELSMFTELDGYSSKQEIQDAYGWEVITDEKMHRLLSFGICAQKKLMLVANSRIV